jgi:hypothetical protein
VGYEILLKWPFAQSAYITGVFPQIFSDFCLFVGMIQFGHMTLVNLSYDE